MAREEHMSGELPMGTGVGTDGSLHSPEEPPAEHGADRSGELGDGVGTDGSLVNPEKDVLDADPEDRDRRDSGTNPPSSK